MTLSWGFLMQRALSKPRDSILNKNVTVTMAAFSVSLCDISWKEAKSKQRTVRASAHFQAQSFLSAWHVPGEHLENAEKGKIFTPSQLALSLPIQVILSAWLYAQAVSCFLNIYLLHIHAFFSYHPSAWTTSSFQNPPGKLLHVLQNSLPFSGIP